MITGIGGLLITILLALFGLVGYFSVAKKAAEEAKAASQQWFDDNLQNLHSKIRGLEQAVEQAQQKIDTSVTGVELASNAAIAHIQKGLNAPNEQAQPISPAEQQALHQSVEQIREKPEASYSFDDWNKRAFEAYQSEQYEDAALYWKRASSIPNAGAAETAQALFNRGVALNKLNRLDEACSTYKQLIDTYSPDNTPSIRRLVAEAMINMGFTLGTMHKLAEEVAVYEQLIAVYSAENTSAIREQVVNALFNKAATFGQMEKPAEEIAAYEHLIAAYSPGNSPAIRKQVARSLFNKGIILLQMQKLEEAVSTYDQLIVMYAPDNIPAMRELVANAMFSNGIALSQMQKPEKAIATYEELIAAYSSDTAPTIRELIAKAMFNKGVVLGRLQKPEAAIATYDQMIAMYSADASSVIREQVVFALNGKGFARLMEAKKAWNNSGSAQALLHEAQSDLRAALKERPNHGMPRGNLAYVQWLLGDPQSAEISFRAALAADQDGGEELYHGTMKDIAQHTILDDSAFRDMVERLWTEYQAAQSSSN